MDDMKDRLEPGVGQHLADIVEDLSDDGELVGAIGASATTSLNSLAISAKRQADALERIAGLLAKVIVGEDGQIGEIRVGANCDVRQA